MRVAVGCAKMYPVVPQIATQILPCVRCWYITKGPDPIPPYQRNCVSGHRKSHFTTPGQGEEKYIYGLSPPNEESTQLYRRSRSAELWLVAADRNKLNLQGVNFAELFLQGYNSPNPHEVEIPERKKTKKNTQNNLQLTIRTTVALNYFMSSTFFIGQSTQPGTLSLS